MSVTLFIMLTVFTHVYSPTKLQRAQYASSVKYLCVHVNWCRLIAMLDELCQKLFF